MTWLDLIKFLTEQSNSQDTQQKIIELQKWVSALTKAAYKTDILLLFALALVALTISLSFWWDNHRLKIRVKKLETRLFSSDNRLSET